MSWDIYGNPLRRGHCEVHPHVHEEYPCSVCMAERSIRNHQQQPSYEIERLNYELDQQNDYIKELTLSNQNLNMALQKVSDYNLRLEESNKSFVSALQKAEAYNVQLERQLSDERMKNLRLETDRDALATQVEALKKAVVSTKARGNLLYGLTVQLIHGSELCGSDWDYISEAQVLEIQQCLTEIKAEAGRAGFVDGARQMAENDIGWYCHHLESCANEYAAKMRQGGE